MKVTLINSSVASVKLCSFSIFNANTFFCTDSQINLETNSLNKDTNLSIQIRKHTSKSRGGFSKLDL